MLTIGSIRIDTGDNRGVEYMCVETGVGSGSVWKESDLYESVEVAQRVADSLALIEAAKFQEQPHIKKIVQFYEHTFTTARIASAEDQSRGYKFRLQDAQKLVFDDLLSDEELRTQLKELLETVDG